MAGYHVRPLDKPVLTLLRQHSQAMAYQTSTLDATLSAAAGNDPVLWVELHNAFLDSAQRQCDLLRRSRCDANWRIAGLRLKMIAASFHAEDLILLADELILCAPGEPTILRRVEEHLSALARTSRS